MFRESEEPSRYLLGQACLNGHPVNSHADKFLDQNADYCARCGEKTITHCPDCSAPIRGHYYVPGWLSAEDWIPPAHCHACGKPYPWIERATSAIDAVVAEMGGMSGDEIEKLRGTVPDIVAETPRSRFAVMLLKKAFGKTDALAREVLMGVLRDYAAAFVKQQLGL